MDIASIIGYVFGILCLLLTMIITIDFNFAGLMSYVDLPSAVLVFGGSVSAAFIATPMDKMMTALKAIGLTLKVGIDSPIESIEKIIGLANVARKEGILALEEAAQTMDDQFLKKGIMLIVDGTDPELVRSILETELSFVQSRHKGIAATWDFIGAMAPAWGMLGTLIGLINMLNNLSDPSNLGPQMSMAMITTLYGAFLADYIALPVANKLKIRDEEECMGKEILIEGMLSIQAGENPRIIEEKLKSFLSPVIRAKVGDSAEGAGGGE